MISPWLWRPMWCMSSLMFSVRKADGVGLKSGDNQLVFKDVKTVAKGNELVNFSTPLKKQSLDPILLC